MATLSVPLILIILARIPATVAPSGTSFTTTALAPTKTLFPIFTFPIILHPAEKTTLSPIVGAPFPLAPPTVTPCINAQWVPITAF